MNKCLNLNHRRNIKEKVDSMGVSELNLTFDVLAVLESHVMKLCICKHVFKNKNGNLLNELIDEFSSNQEPVIV